MANLKSDATCIRDELTKYGSQTWGFFIYRTCYYNDNARWESFLERMEGFAQRTLLDPRTHNSNGDGQALYDQLEWNIQSDPSLEGCSKEEIWRRHRELMKSLYGDYHATLVQHGFPIIVDKEALDSVLEGKPPAEWRGSDSRQSMTHVIVLDMQWFDLRDAPHEEEDLGSEVGWAKVLLAKVYPRLYSILQSGLWIQVVYNEPPTISRLP